MGNQIVLFRRRKSSIFTAFIKFNLATKADGALRPHRSRTISPALSSALDSQIGASALCFTHDSRRLVIATWTGARVVLVDLDQGSLEVVVRVFDVHSGRGSNNDERHEDVALATRISRVAVSPDSQWLASADSGGQVCVFNLDSVKVRLAFFHLNIRLMRE